MKLDVGTGTMFYSYQVWCLKASELFSYVALIPPPQLTYFLIFIALHTEALPPHIQVMHGTEVLFLAQQMWRGVEGKSLKLCEQSAISRE